MVLAAVASQLDVTRAVHRLKCSGMLPSCSAHDVQRICVALPSLTLYDDSSNNVPPPAGLLAAYTVPVCYECDLAVGNDDNNLGRQSLNVSNMLRYGHPC